METLTILLLVLQGLLGMNGDDASFKQHLDDQAIIDAGVYANSEGVYDQDQLKLLYIEANDAAKADGGGVSDWVSAN